MTFTTKNQPNLSSTETIFSGVTIQGVTPSSTFLRIYNLAKGYTSGGWNSYTSVNNIDSFPFATNSNAADVGDLPGIFHYGAGNSSITSGYNTTGRDGSTAKSSIDKFPFASNANATTVGNVTVGRYGASGTNSSVSGYAAGGRRSTAPAGSTNIIDKFPFASDGNSTDVGDLFEIRFYTAGQTSSTHGYTSVGDSTNAYIDKFPFASNSNASFVGNISPFVYSTTGIHSSDHGYVAGGEDTPSFVKTARIDRFPFSTDSNSSNIGNLTVARKTATGISSNSYGYVSGGMSPAEPPVGFGTNIIDRFLFSASVSATDVGDLTVGRYSGSSQQG